MVLYKKHSEKETFLKKADSEYVVSTDMTSPTFLFWAN